ncbi:hypothetical protein J2Z31_005316 [Sinorhizobium kostiense]|uniref:Transposase n=1 Tax=Sinorhizobium kostiense TaxID=76747 RepID=A0ABS4R795_9HYPH|nr:hypothetical protein [Sinorhizobium kostiense]
MPLPAKVEPADGIGIGLDIVTGQTLRHLSLLQHDPLALERERQLRADIALFALAQDLLQPIRRKIDGTMQVAGAGSRG